MDAAAFAQRETVKAIGRAWGPKAARVAKRIERLAARQGGATMRENYELLARRSAGIALAAAAGIAVGAVAGGIAISRAVAVRSAERVGRKRLADKAAEGDAEEAAAE